MYIDDTQLKKFALDSGLVSRAEIEEAEKKAGESKQPFSDTLVSLGHLSEDDLRRMQAYVIGIPFISLSKQKVDFETLSLIPEPVARTHNIIAYKKNEDSLEVAMLNTDDLSAIDFIKKKVGLKILPRLTDAESVKSALRQYQKTLKDEFGDIIVKEASSLKVVAEGESEHLSEAELKKMADDLPVVRIVDTLLRHAIIQEASDIHIEPMEKEVIVRYRIDGILHDAMSLPKHAGPTIVARIKVLSSLKLDEKRLPQDGRFKMEMESQRVAFRVSTLPTYFGEKVVMRLLKEGRAGFTLEGIGFHGTSLERIHEATKQKIGLVLVTGPTGSGKTTTLYTVLDTVNSPDVNISTIEDPIEYQLARVNQTQVKPEIGFTFATGLRSLMRQDPDIILVGEIRDGETASLGINAALTGHLVLATLHTNSAAGAVPRMIDMGSEEFLLVSTVKVVIGQRLVRKLTSTRETYTLSQSEIAVLDGKVNLDKILEALKTENVVAPTATWETIQFAKPKPSAESGDGYAGRIGIHEVLPITDTIKDMVMKKATSDDIEEQARKEGMLTMLEDGIFKAAQGITTIEEVFRVISE